MFNGALTRSYLLVYVLSLRQKAVQEQKGRATSKMCPLLDSARSASKGEGASQWCVQVWVILGFVQVCKNAFKVKKSDQTWHKREQMGKTTERGSVVVTLQLLCEWRQMGSRNPQEGRFSSAYSVKTVPLHHLLINTSHQANNQQSAFTERGCRLAVHKTHWRGFVLLPLTPWHIYWIMFNWIYFVFMTFKAPHRPQWIKTAF